MKTLIILFFILFSQLIQANDYTAVFLHEERETRQEKPWALGLAATSITNHPVLSIQALKLNSLYKPDVRIRLGGSLRINQSDLNSSTKLMNDRLINEGKEVAADFSDMIAGLEFQYLPLMGHVSFMDKASLATLFGVSFELARSIGAQENVNIIYPGLFFELETYSNIFLSLFTRQYIEVNGAQNSFTEVGLGVQFAL